MIDLDEKFFKYIVLYIIHTLSSFMFLDMFYSSHTLFQHLVYLHLHLLCVILVDDIYNNNIAKGHICYIGYNYSYYLFKL